MAGIYTRINKIHEDKDMVKKNNYRNSYKKRENFIIK